MEIDNTDSSPRPSDCALVKQKGKSVVLEVAGYVPVAAEVPVQLDQVVRRSYGHYLEEFVPGTVFVHPRGVTLDRGRC